MTTPLLDVLRLETAVGPTSRISNHSGNTLSVSGWSTDLTPGNTTTGISRLSGLPYGFTNSILSGAVVRYTFTGTAAASVTRLYLPLAVVDGTLTGGPSYFGGSLRVRKTAGATLTAALRIAFRPSGLTYPISAPVALADTRTRFLSGIEAKTPDATADARLYLEVQVPAGAGITYTLDVWHGTVMQGLERAELNNVPFKAIGDSNYDILSDTLAITASRGASRTGVTDTLEPGNLKATVRNANLAPAKYRYLRPGYPVRLRVLVAGTWRTIATQRVDKGSVSTPTKTDPGRVDVVLEALDGVTTLANAPAPFVSTGSYRQRVEAAVGMARNVLVADLGATVTTPVQVTPADSTTALTQLHRIRNSAHAIAFLDVNDTVRGYAADSLPSTAPAFVFTDTPTAGSNVLSYTDIERDYGTDDLVNTLYVDRINLNEEDGAKEYGPYVAEESEAEWGTREDRVEVVDGDPGAHAAYFLTGATQPNDYVRGLTFDVDPDEAVTLAAAALELYTAVQVRHAGTTGTYRVIGIDHAITSRKWTVSLTLRPLEPTGAALPVADPPGGPGTGPGDLDPVAAPIRTTFASRYRTVTQTLTTNTPTTVSLNGFEVEDPDLAYDATNRWFVVTRAGLYQINAVVGFAANTTGYRIALVQINGVTRRQNTTGTAPGVAASVALSLSARLGVGDKVALIAQHNAGANLDVIAGLERTSLDITRTGT